MYVAITCSIMTCSISKGFVTYHGSMECEINYSYNYSYELLLTHISFAASSVNCKHIVFSSS